MRFENDGWCYAVTDDTPRTGRIGEQIIRRLEQQARDRVTGRRQGSAPTGCQSCRPDLYPGREQNADNPRIHEGHIALRWIEDEHYLGHISATLDGRPVKGVIEVCTGPGCGFIIRHIEAVTNGVTHYRACDCGAGIACEILIGEVAIRPYEKSGADWL
jgi:hypothetical protein